MIVNESDIKKNSNNFDFIRFLAAVFVLIGHSSYLIGQKEFQWDLFRFLFGIKIQTLGVYLFFILSGFLITKSWINKNTINDFIIARILRIFPGVICVVLLSTFVLGTLLTTLELGEYLKSPITLKYLLDITLYRMYYYLPGVFESNITSSSINGSLWTLPYEFTCYIIILGLGILKIINKKWIALSLLILSFIIYLFLSEKINQLVIPILGVDFKKFTVFLLYFLSGSIFYIFLNKIRFCALGLIICLIGIILIKSTIIPSLTMIFILPYLLFYISFSKKIKLNKFGKYGDFSYGIYLYSYPLQQIIVYIFPELHNVGIMIFLSFIITIPFAYLSWNYIESPSLKFRYLLRNR